METTSEGLTTVNFGAGKLVDTARDTSGLDIYNTNHSFNLQAIPNGVSGGPLSVTTPGGTSAIYALSFSGISSTLGSGTAANGGQAAANPGQAIIINGTGLDVSTDVVFTTVNVATPAAVICEVSTSALLYPRQ